MSQRKAFPLRLSPELYEEIKRWADAELRSVNGQIEYVLRRAVQERRGQVRDDASLTRRPLPRKQDETPS